MTAPTWRNIHPSPRFDARLDFYFGTHNEASSFIAQLLHREIIPHVFQAFKEDWEQLPPVHPGIPDGRERYYDYTSELASADLIIFGRLDSISIYQNYVEEDITLYDLVVRADGSALEDPDGPVPDR